MDFESPFLVTYVCNSLFVIYLPMWQLLVYLRWVKDPPRFSLPPPIEVSGGSGDSSSHSSGSQRSDTASDESDIASAKTLISHMDSPPKREPIADDEPTYSHYDAFKVALIISPIWFVANCLYNYSLLMTSVTSSTIIR